jgi:hypothetical protein
MSRENIKPSIQILIFPVFCTENDEKDGGKGPVFNWAELLHKQSMMVCKIKA